MNKIIGNNTIEELENVFWGKPEYNSGLVKACHRLRKKKIADFEIEDLRIMIGQNIGSLFLIPVAIEKLRENILAEGDFYQGDLLNSVLKSEQVFWKIHPDLKQQVITIFETNIAALNEFETTDEIRVAIFEAYATFKNI